MKQMIAFCGLDCEQCDAYIATKESDEVLRAAVAKKWSELNGVEITPDMIYCDGCRMDGRKTPYCESLCPIKKCAMQNSYATCADCPELRTCKDLSMIIGNNEKARRNLIGE